MEILLVSNISKIHSNQLDDTPFQKAVTKYVASILPNTNITPIVFRRVIPSLVWSKDIRPSDMSMTDFIRDYGGLVCTSDKVLFQHYIRVEADEKSEQIQSLIEDKILMSPAGKMFDKILLII